MLFQKPPSCINLGASCPGEGAIYFAVLKGQDQTRCQNLFSVMGQSLYKNYVHIVFSTKHRQPLITPPFDIELYNYVGGICRNLECNPVIVGGHLDHVHILCLLSKKIPLMTFIGELKAHSSKWMKTKGKGFENFYWQNGYGAFSVNPNDVDIVKSYISNQNEHHLRTMFQDEYRGFLKKYQIEYDEKYVWD